MGRPRLAAIRSARLAALAVMAGWASAAAGSEAGPRVTFNDLGATGLLQMPSGRMAREGEFALGGSQVAPYRRLWLTIQGLPWLQGTLRYTDIIDRPYGEATYLDKAFDLKLRLLEEGPHWPEVSVGLRDIGGTGLFSSEYIAATRRYYDWDFTLGLAWGNMGTRGHFSNPLRLLSESFSSRTGDGGPTGGQLRSEFFRGETVGVFAGVEWNTPIDGLKLLVEYDSNSYEQEPSGEPIEAEVPVNAGLSYQLFPWLNIGVGVERGNKVMMRTALRANFNDDPGVPKVAEPPPVPIPQPQPQGSKQGPAPGPDVPLAEANRRLMSAASRAGLDVVALDLVPPTATLVVDGMPSLSAGERDDLAALTERFARLAPAETEAVVVATRGGEVLKRRDVAPVAGEVVAEATAPVVFDLLRQQGLTPWRFGIKGGTAILVYRQDRYRNGMKAAVRAARAVVAAMPEDIRQVQVIETRRGVPVRAVRFLRRDIARAARGEISAEEALRTTESLPPAMPAEVAWHEADLYPRFKWSLEPRLREVLGSPREFLYYQVTANGSASLELWPGMAVAGQVGVDLLNNFDDMSLPPGSRLPHVRTDIERYIKDNPAWIDSLHLSQVLGLGEGWYASLYAGLFERMFGGVGGEVLYAPEGRRWALGLDVNRVRQRDFDGGFGFRDYEITTGHLSYYHDLPWYDLGVKLSAGQYLAGDVGATLELNRTFKNGITVGVWATKTNVSAEEFGEGGFDKGFYISIPFDLFTTVPTRSRASFAYRPLTRDGGQKVGRPLLLHDLVRGDEWRPLEADWGLQ